MRASDFAWVVICGWAATGSALADDDGAAIIGNQAGLCWSIPFGAADAAMTFDVILDEEGVPEDIAVKTYSPGTELGVKAVRSASAAIEACGPYNVPAGTYSVEIPAAPLKAPIDPFTPLGD